MQSRNPLARTFHPSLRAPRVRELFIATATLVAVTVAAIGWEQSIAVFVGRRESRWDAADFATLYAAAKLVLHGHAAQLYHPSALAPVEHQASNAVSASAGLAYLNPPFFALLLSPLAALSDIAAFRLWTVVNLIALGLVGGIIWYYSKEETTRVGVLLLGGVLTAYPVTFALRLGQFSLILLLGWTLTFVLLRAGKEWLGGASAAIMLVKPEWCIPLALLLLYQRRWRALTSLLVVSAVAIFVSFVMVGWFEAFRLPAFLFWNSGHVENGTRPDLMFNWIGLVGASLGRTHYHAAAVASLPLATGSVWLFIRYVGHRFNGVISAEMWLALTILTLLCDPNLYLQDTALVLSPAVFWFVSREERGSLMSLWLIAGWSLMAVGFAPNSLRLNLLALMFAISLVALTVPTLFQAEDEVPLFVEA